MLEDNKQEQNKQEGNKQEVQTKCFLVDQGNPSTHIW